MQKLEQKVDELTNVVHDLFKRYDSQMKELIEL